MLEQSKGSPPWLQRQAEMWGRDCSSTASYGQTSLLYFQVLLGESIPVVALYHRSASPLSVGAVLSLLAVVVGGQVHMLMTGPTLTKWLKAAGERNLPHSTPGRTTPDRDSVREPHDRGGEGSDSKL
jgi:hypothetical protein